MNNICEYSLFPGSSFSTARPLLSPLLMKKISPFPLSRTLQRRVRHARSEEECRNVKENKKTKTSLLLPPLRNHHTFSFSLFFVLSVEACLSFPISHDHLLALALHFSKITLFHSTGAKYYLNAAMQRWSGAIYQPLWLYSNALNNRMHWCNAGIQGYKSLVFVFSAHLEQIVA